MTSSEAPTEKTVPLLFAVITFQGRGSSENRALQSSWGQLRTEAREESKLEKRKEQDQILN